MRNQKSSIFGFDCDETLNYLSCIAWFYKGAYVDKLVNNPHHTKEAFLAWAKDVGLKIDFLEEKKFTCRECGKTTTPFRATKVSV